MDLKKNTFKYKCGVLKICGYLPLYAELLKILKDEGWSTRYCLTLLGISEIRAKKWKEKNIDFEEAWYYKNEMGRRLAEYRRNRNNK